MRPRPPASERPLLLLFALSWVCILDALSHPLGLAVLMNLSTGMVNSEGFVHAFLEFCEFLMLRKDHRQEKRHFSDEGGEDSSS